jgi:hypothetical protein
MQLHDLMVGSSALRGNGTAGLRLHVGVTGRKADKYGYRTYDHASRLGTLPIWKAALLRYLDGPTLQAGVPACPQRGDCRGCAPQMVYSQTTDLLEGHRKMPPTAGQGYDGPEREIGICAPICMFLVS